MYRLFARPGWGSVLVEAQLAWYGLPYEVEDLDDLFKSTEARERLRPVNPLAQVPTLVLPDGQVLTESAAITLHLVDATQSTDLVPALGENVRPAFLRWLIFLVANNERRSFHTTPAAVGCRNRWFADSPLEGTGFEISVPRYPWWSRGSPTYAIRVERRVASEFVLIGLGSKASSLVCLLESLGIPLKARILRESRSLP